MCSKSREKAKKEPVRHRSEAEMGRQAYEQKEKEWTILDQTAKHQSTGKAGRGGKALKQQKYQDPCPPGRPNCMQSRGLEKSQGTAQR